MRTFHPVFLVAVAAACVSRQTPHQKPVPAFAPDTVPPGWLDDANLTTDARSLYSFVRDVVVVLFRRGTSQPERADAVRSVSGEVVGGMRMDSVDGVYYVRLPRDSTNDRVFQAIRTLERHQAVRAASLKIVFFNSYRHRFR
jgi:hypothetical protein